METLLKTKIPKSAKSILYLCDYNHKTKTIKVIGERIYNNRSEGILAYSEIPNPESQLIEANSFKELIDNLEILHKNMKDPVWLKFLSECL